MRPCCIEPQNTLKIKTCMKLPVPVLYVLLWSVSLHILLARRKVDSENYGIIMLEMRLWRTPVKKYRLNNKNNNHHQYFG